jgi:hypothetical protein
MPSRVSTQASYNGLTPSEIDVSQSDKRNCQPWAPQQKLGSTRPVSFKPRFAEHLRKRRADGDGTVTNSGSPDSSSAWSAPPAHPEAEHSHAGRHRCARLEALVYEPRQ